MKKPVIINRRHADENNDVVLVLGGRGSYRRTPCADCPWRVDAIGAFPAEAFMHAAGVGTDGSAMLERWDDATHTFGCHTSGAKAPATCAGYILRSQDAIGWRLAVAQGKFDPGKVSDGGVALHETYYDMAVANGVDPDDPSLRHCKPWRDR